MVVSGQLRCPIKSRITMCCTGVRVVADFCKFKLVRPYPVNTTVNSNHLACCTGVRVVADFCKFKLTRELRPYLGEHDPLCHLQCPG
jgi:hypothetical protein